MIGTAAKKESEVILPIHEHFGVGCLAFKRQHTHVLDIQIHNWTLGKKKHLYQHNFSQLLYYCMPNMDFKTV